MQKKWMIIAVLLISLFLVSIVVAAPNASSIDWWVIGGGGGSDTASAASLSGTIGQWAVGSDVVAGVQLCSGFWCGAGERMQNPAPELSWVYLPLALKNPP